MLDNLELIGTGFALVMTVLASLWGACEVIGFAFTRRKPAPVEPAPEAAETSVAEGVPPHHLAAISAAVAHVMGSSAQIIHVQAPAHLVDGWPMEGRIETFTAHRIRTDWGPTRPMLGGETPDILRGKTQ